MNFKRILHYIVGSWSKNACFLKEVRTVSKGINPNVNLGGK